MTTARNSHAAYSNLGGKDKLQSKSNKRLDVEQDKNNTTTTTTTFLLLMAPQLFCWALAALSVS
jgi:hypothetical protein